MAFLHPLCTGKNDKERQAATENCTECLSPLLGTSNYTLTSSEFGNQFLPFGSPARKISIITDASAQQTV